MTVSLFLRKFSVCDISHGRSSKKMPLGHSATYHFWKDTVCTEGIEEDQMMAITVSSFKEFSGHAIMYDKYYDGRIAGCYGILGGGPSLVKGVRKDLLEARMCKPRPDN